MSTFGGKIKEIADISVDRFDEDNYESYAFFLSHCHTDHMVGLNTSIFQNILLDYNLYIYASEVSCVILKKMYPLIENNVKILDIYNPTLIPIKDKIISVTPLPAGHCPGSVMFLFEISNKLVLYTGDYRIDKNDIRKLKSFYNSMNEIRPIEKIYLDTTFFSKSYLTFPKRKDSLRELCKIIKEWIENGNNYIIHLITSAKYGYENLFNEIYKTFGMPVHVNNDVYQIYSIIPEMDNSVTVQEYLTQIHSNCGNAYQTICFESYGKKIRTVKVSAFRWTKDILEGGLSSVTSDIYCVCYSTHASYEEGVELIKFLKPKSIEACVRQSDSSSDLEMLKLLRETLKEFARESEESEENESSEPKLFDTSSDCFQDDDPGPVDLDDKFGIFDSPPRGSVEDLGFLKKPCESFGLNTKYEKLEIGCECIEEVGHKEFNFKEEFAIDGPSTSSAVDKMHCEMKTSIVNNLWKENEFKIEKENCEHLVAEASNKLQTEPDELTKWFLDLPPKTYTNIEKETNVETSGNFIKLEEVKESASGLCDVNKYMSENGSDLLKQIYFLDESPPLDREVDRFKKQGDDSESILDSSENNDVASNSWIFYLTPSNLRESENFDVRSETNSPPRKKK